MSPLEVEVKFYLRDPDHVRDTIEKTGGAFKKKEHEENIRFEDNDSSLVKNGSLLRLRRTEDCNTLTYKGKVVNPHPGYKVFDEIETLVSDFNETTRILKNLGYAPVQRYEKIRETYLIGQTHLCLDTMPYGVFLEIEGGAEVIPTIAESLGFDWGDRIIENYLAIFERLKEAFQLDFNDLTFDNFRDADVDFVEFMETFTVAHQRE